MSDADFNQQEESEKRMFEEAIKQGGKNLVEAEKGLRILRLPFKADEISKLPKPTKAQTEAVKTNYRAGTRCTVCGAWHHPDAVHLDYVGHAALTDRLLDADLFWSWEPLAFTDKGLPQFDDAGGLWIKLDVCGMTRLGYGNAENKSSSDVGAREKEVIGDALRNAAMRFGAALDLWHKGKTPLYEEDPEEPKGNGINKNLEYITEQQVAEIDALIKRVKADKVKLLAHFKASSVDKILAAGYKAVINALKVKELQAVNKKPVEQVNQEDKIDTGWGGLSPEDISQDAPQ